MEVGALGLLLLLFFADSCRFMWSSLPYSMNWDERYTIPPAAHVALTPTWEPGIYTYPSFPIYLAAAGIKIGSWFETHMAPPPPDTKVYEKVYDWYPTFTNPKAVFGAKVVFTLIGTLTLLWVALLAKCFTRKSSAQFFALGLLAIAPVFLVHSRVYVNVDIVGACCSIGCICYLLFNERKNTILSRSVIPGILLGLSIASKYQLGLVMIPCLLSIWLYDENERKKKSLLLLAVGAATFLLTVPYFIIDNPQFLRGIGYSAYHYYNGFALYGPRGLPQLLLYLKGVLDAYGIAFVLVGALGYFYQARLHPKRTLILVAFPAALTLFMCCLREHSWRNVLPAYFLFPVLVAAGVDAIAEKLKFRFRDVASTIAVALTGIFFLGIPRLKECYLPYPETRVVAKQWIEINLEQGATLVVADELKFDKALDKRHSVRRVSVEDTAAIKEILAENKPTYFLMPKLSSEFATQQMRQTLGVLADYPGVRSVKEFGGAKLPMSQYFVHFASPSVVVIKK
jgi:4-amino-4-deoxy-L-arabinose transferase-like glycosyltransferase